MRTTGRIGAAVVAGVLLWAGLGGCGELRNAYVGRWDGSIRFINPAGDSEDAGRLQITVSPDGQFLGTYERFDTGEIADVSGSLHAGGSFRMDWVFDGYSSPRSCVGTVTKENGRLRPSTENGLLTTRNDRGTLSQGLEFELNFRG